MQTQCKLQHVHLRSASVAILIFFGSLDLRAA